MADDFDANFDTFQDDPTETQPGLELTQEPTQAGIFDEQELMQEPTQAGIFDEQELMQEPTQAAIFGEQELMQEPTQAAIFGEQELTQEQTQAEESGFAGKEEFDEADLFGDDDDVASGDEAGPQPEIADLFGDEADGNKGFVKEELPPKVVKEEAEAGVESKVEAEEPQMDPEDEERDLFGELSDDESDIGREVEDHSVRKRLLPDGEVFVFKIPNTLSVEMEPYNAENLESSLGFKQRQNEYGRPAVELCGPENTIRWRLKTDEQGQKVLDDHGEAIFDSNAQFVEWEDGSLMLQVGDEYFECQNRPETRSHLYVEEEDNLFVFHKPLTKQMQVVPSGFNTKTHERLLNSQINKVRASRTVKPLSHLQAEKKNREQEMEAEAVRQHQTKKFISKRFVMDANYLEGEDVAEGPSLKALKKNPLGGGFLQRASDILR